MNATTPAVFKFQDHPVRSIIKDGEPWFVAVDLCDTLSIRNPTQAVARLDDDERAMFNIGHQGEVNIISESGLYALVLRSRKPEARKFAKWVTSEVLPAIRKTGKYDVRTDAGPITKEMQKTIKELVIERAKVLPLEKQAGAIVKVWSALKSHFGVSYKQIPAEKYADALSLVARLQAEWEVVDTLPAMPAAQASYHYPLEAAKPVVDTMIEAALTPARLLDPRNRPLEVELLDQLEKDGHDVSGVRARLGAMRVALEYSEMARKRMEVWEHRMMGLVEEVMSYKSERGLDWSMSGAYLQRSMHR